MKNCSARILTICLTTALAAMCANAVAVPTLIGHWPLDETGGETAADFVNGNNGQWQNAGPTNLVWGAGQIGGAADVSDVDDNGNYFTIAAIPQLENKAGWTISAWINPDDQSNGYKGIFMSRTTNGGGSWGLALEGGGSPYHTDNRHNVNGGLDTPDIIEVDGSWYHVANTWSAATGKRHAYVNGALVASSPGDQGPGNVGAITDSGTWFIGYDDCCGNRDFGGSIDDVALYDAPLNPASVAAIYEAGLAGNDASTVNVVPEPTTLLLGSLFGVVCIAARRRTRLSA